MELQPDDGPRSSLGIGPSSDYAVGPHRELTRRFVKGIGKLTRNTPRDHRKKTGRLTARILEVVGLAGISTGKPPVSSDWTTRTVERGRLLAVEPPRSVVEPPIPGFQAADDE
ncbi:hypothetical protein B296_00049183 [Ensete ventricosum]|uniref:Uncharacterized protein n=1 Tax=Ensete ventricosum TaxID=4639 RepID=A0A426YDG6_ENSVE|nr:hypothetical protein B296_00049183 [Ensete ventricosum]